MTIIRNLVAAHVLERHPWTTKFTQSTILGTRRLTSLPTHNASVSSRGSSGALASPPTPASTPAPTLKLTPTQSPTSSPIQSKIIVEGDPQAASLAGEKFDHGKTGRTPAPTLQQSHQPRQGDLTMEEREDLMELLIAVGDEFCDGGEDLALDEVLPTDGPPAGRRHVGKWPTTRELLSLAFTTSGAAPFDASISRSTTATRMPATRTTASRNSSVALLVGTQWRPSVRPRPGPIHAVEAARSRTRQRELAVSVSWCPPWGTLNIPGRGGGGRELAETERALAVSVSRIRDACAPSFLYQVHFDCILVGWPRVSCPNWLSWDQIRWWCSRWQTFANVRRVGKLFSVMVVRIHCFFSDNWGQDAKIALTGRLCSTSSNFRRAGRKLAVTNAISGMTAGGALLRLERTTAKSC